jgi:hypothetical protein
VSHSVAAGCTPANARIAIDHGCGTHRGGLEHVLQPMYRCLRQDGARARLSRQEALRAEAQIVLRRPARLCATLRTATQVGHCCCSRPIDFGGGAWARGDKDGVKSCPQELATHARLDSGSSIQIMIILRNRKYRPLAAGGTCGSELLRLAALEFGKALVDRGVVLRLVLRRLDRSDPPPIANVAWECDIASSGGQAVRIQRRLDLLQL